MFKNTLIDGICCCLQTCHFVYFMLLTVCICVLSFIDVNATMTQLQAWRCPHYNVLAEAICCCLLKTTLFTRKWICPLLSVYGNLLLWKISWLDLISFLSYRHVCVPIIMYWSKLFTGGCLLLFTHVYHYFSL